MRLPTHGGLMVWDLEKDGEDVNVRVDGQWTFNGSSAVRRAALAGAGLAYLPEDMVLEDIAAGALRRVMPDWCDPFDGYYAYYPSRRQSSSAMRVVIEALRAER
jgi:DNA-binding transcriptional LysR family regulator